MLTAVTAAPGTEASVQQAQMHVCGGVQRENSQSVERPLN